MRDDTNNAPTQDAQMESTGSDIRREAGRSIRSEVGSSECEKEAADGSKSEAKLVDVANTFKRAISERMRVIRVPSHRRRHKL